MAEKKSNCKYWDKCYQKNLEHHQKYNHPESVKPKPAKLPDQGQNKKERLSPLDSNNAKRQKIFPGPTSSNELSPSTVPTTSDEESSISDSNEITKIVSDSSSEGSNSDDNSEIKKMETENLSENLKTGYIELFESKVRHAFKDKYLALMKTPAFIKDNFLVEMPQEFFIFWVFCNSLAKENIKPEMVFNKFGLILAGPFDYLCGKFNDTDQAASQFKSGEFLRHWRFYYDPPEFQTVFVKKGSGIHYGYWRDDPTEKENLLIARNDSRKNCEFEFVGSNCFETILFFLQRDFAITPFTATEIKILKNKIQEFAAENKIKLDSVKSLNKERNKKVVAKTFHRVGLVVPFERKTQLGYRPLQASESELRKIFNKFEKANGDDRIIAGAMEELHSIANAANIAVDECDFGTAIELGLDLFLSGYSELHHMTKQILIPGYSMLNRSQFIKIIEAHLENRRKDINLSIFDSKNN